MDKRPHYRFSIKASQDTSHTSCIYLSPPTDRPDQFAHARESMGIRIWEKVYTSCLRTSLVPRLIADAEKRFSVCILQTDGQAYGARDNN